MNWRSDRGRRAWYAWHAGYPRVGLGDGDGSIWTRVYARWLYKRRIRLGHAWWRWWEWRRGDILPLGIFLSLMWTNEGSVCSGRGGLIGVSGHARMWRSPVDMWWRVGWIVRELWRGTVGRRMEDRCDRHGAGVTGILMRRSRTRVLWLLVGAKLWSVWPIIRSRGTCVSGGHLTTSRHDDDRRATIYPRAHSVSDSDNLDLTNEGEWSRNVWSIGLITTWIHTILGADPAGEPGGWQLISNHRS